MSSRSLLRSLSTSSHRHLTTSILRASSTGYNSTPVFTSNSSRSFHTSFVKMVVKAGDPIPSVDLFEDSPGNKVNLAQAIKGKGLIIGVPAAFSPSCSETHIPGYINSAATKTAGDVYVVSVNDAFVMKAWGKNLDPEGKSKIHFVADPEGSFTKALDVGFNATAVLGNTRSKRYAIKVDGGKVTEVAVEPDNTGVNVSAVDKVLGSS